ncbi:MAG TPA: 2-amino-4-hydroxy-6-hydroxymethyldihydropteridine pyrophosphokinase [Prevotella sp.]|nr:2-amino-4-hydroxy-6-hydroxymethyldihydropteridine pyrophosphokinase [Prevotella sp.]
MTTHRMIISLGTNYEADTNMKLARELLCSFFHDITFTESIWTLSVDTEKIDPRTKYLNCLAKINTLYELGQIEPVLKQIEGRLGRSTAEKSLGIIRIDIDILKFDDEKHHLNDWNRPYVHHLLKNIK